jgi:hypothetical protein
MNEFRTKSPDEIAKEKMIFELETITQLVEQIKLHREAIARASGRLAASVRELALNDQMPTESMVVYRGYAFHLDHMDYWSDLTDLKYWAEDALDIIPVQNLSYEQQIHDYIEEESFAEQGIQATEGDYDS